jgi:hypothetical protein
LNSVLLFEILVIDFGPVPKLFLVNDVMDAEQVIDEVVEQVRHSRKEVQVKHSGPILFSVLRCDQDFVESYDEMDDPHQLPQVRNPF